MIRIRKVLPRNSGSVVRKVNNDKLSAGVIGLVILYMMSSHATDILRLLTLFTLVIMGAAFLRIFPARVGVEFVTLTVFIITSTLDIWIGLLAGVFALITHISIAGDSLSKRLPSFLGIIPLVFISAKLATHTSYGPIGVLLTLAYDATTLPVYYLMNARALNIMLFVITHLTFNYFAFSVFASLILGL